MKVRPCRSIRSRRQSPRDSCGVIKRVHIDAPLGCGCCSLLRLNARGELLNTGLTRVVMRAKRGVQVGWGIDIERCALGHGGEGTECGRDQPAGGLGQTASARKPLGGLVLDGPSAPGLLLGKHWALIGSALSGSGSHVKAGRSDVGPVRHESGSRCSRRWPTASRSMSMRPPWEAGALTRAPDRAECRSRCSPALGKHKGRGHARTSRLSRCASRPWEAGRPGASDAPASDCPHQPCKPGVGQRTPRRLR